MTASKRDTEVVIQRPVTTNDPVYNEPVVTWHSMATVWAEVKDVLPSRSEQLTQGINIANHPARVRMLWRDDVTADMRLKMRGKYWRIVGGPSDIGFNKEIEIMVETSTVEGVDLEPEYPGS